MVVMMAPLCEMKAIFPGLGETGSNVVLIPWWGSMSPRQFGPMIRIPYWRAVARTSFLQHPACFTRFAEPRGDDDHERDLLLPGFFYDLRHTFCRDRDNRHIHVFRNMRKRRVGLTPEDLRCLRVDRDRANPETRGGFA